LCPLKKGKMGAEIKNEYINEHVLKQWIWHLVSISVLCGICYEVVLCVGLYVQSRTDNLKLREWRSGAKRKGSGSGPVGQYPFKYIAPGRNPSHKLLVITSFHFTFLHTACYTEHKPTNSQSNLY
jgi:hypothetical protein